MFEGGILTILIFFGVIAMTAVVFCVWIVVTIVRLIFRGIVGAGRVMLPNAAKLPPMPAATRGIVCQHPDCRATSPAGARFCRRCGRELPQPQRVVARRAAMF
jgi:hypothetical protein